MTDKKQGDFSDMMNTMQDALSSVVVYIYADLVRSGVVDRAQAVDSMRRLAVHMRAKEHHSHVIGEGMARKFDDMALIIETSDVQDVQ